MTHFLKDSLFILPSCTDNTADQDARYYNLQEELKGAKNVQKLNLKNIENSC